MIARHYRAAVIDFAAALHAGTTARVDRAAVINTARCREQGIAFAADVAAVFNPAIRRQRDAACLRADVPGVAYPDAAFGAHHPDFTGVHAAKAGYVERHLRTGRRIVSGFINALMRRVHQVAASGDVKFVAPDPGIHIDRAGDDIGIVGAGSIQPLAFNVYLAALDVIAGQRTVVELRLAGGERGAVGVNESAAVTGNA